MYIYFLFIYNNIIMNQILFTNDNKFKKSKKKVKNFKLIFFVSLIVIIISFSYYIYSYMVSSKKENMSSMLLNTFNIQRLYSAQDNYTTIPLNNNKDFFVIGSIEIPSIDITYPILSDTNDELLKIAPCRFYGPYPNEIGNLCIAAHNYDDTRFFSGLHRLNIGDKINIYDSSNSLITYYVYDKYEINENDISCTSQNTYGKKEITLVTCNNLNGNRLIVKAKQ